jgi:hypothetical protein
MGACARLGRASAAAVVAAIAAVSSARAAAVAVDTLPWPGGEIPVHVDAAVPRDSDRYRDMLDAMTAWEAATGVRFRLSDAPASPMLYVADNRDSVKSCYSTVGFNPQLRWGRREFGGGFLIIGRCSRGSVLHEFGHVLGLMHEHQRSDRDLYIDVGPVAGVLRGCSGLLPRCGEVGASLAASPVPERLRSDYDPCSLMHYLADQTRQGAIGRLPPGGDWTRWYRLTPAGEANARRCRAKLTPTPGCDWMKTGQKCEITCQDADLVATFYGLPPRLPCWTAAPQG